MGKYMKKSTVKEVSPQQTIAHGVRTRAKTLALQHRLSPAGVLVPEPSSLSYLQLRSRRLQKPPPPPLKSASKQSQQANSTKCSPRSSSRLTVGPAGWASVDDLENEVENGGRSEDFWLEAYSGENALESQNSGRRSRESTPHNLIQNPDTIRRTPPEPTTRPKNTSQRARNDQLLGEIPTMHEMEEFFAYAEQQQQRRFRDKYNFDIANDLPIPGRFEWLRLV